MTFQILKINCCYRSPIEDIHRALARVMPMLLMRRLAGTCIAGLSILIGTTMAMAQQSSSNGTGASGAPTLLNTINTENAQLANTNNTLEGAAIKFDSQVDSENEDYFGHEAVVKNGGYSYAVPIYWFWQYAQPSRVSRDSSKVYTVNFNDESDPQWNDVMISASDKPQAARQGCVDEGHRWIKTNFPDRGDYLCLPVPTNPAIWVYNPNHHDKYMKMVAVTSCPDNLRARVPKCAANGCLPDPNDMDCEQPIWDTFTCKAVAQGDNLEMPAFKGGCTDVDCGYTEGPNSVIAQCTSISGYFCNVDCIGTDCAPEKNDARCSGLAGYKVGPQVPSYPLELTPAQAQSAPVPAAPQSSPAPAQAPQQASQQPPPGPPVRCKLDASVVGNPGVSKAGNCYDTNGSLVCHVTCTPKGFDYLNPHCYLDRGDVSLCADAVRMTKLTY